MKKPEPGACVINRFLRLCRAHRAVQEIIYTHSGGKLRRTAGLEKRSGNFLAKAVDPLLLPSSTLAMLVLRQD